MLFKEKQIRSDTVRTAKRNRECFGCFTPIVKGEMYNNLQIRYDGTIITFSFHKECPESYGTFKIKPEHFFSNIKQ